MGQIVLPPESPLVRAMRGWPAPGVKPTVPVEIDWSNPLARGLRFAWVGGNRDLVSGNTPTVDTAARVIAGQHGECASLGATGASETNSLEFALAGETIKPVSMQFSTMSMCPSLTATVNQYRLTAFSSAIWAIRHDFTGNNLDLRGDLGTERVDTANIAHTAGVPIHTWWDGSNGYIRNGANSASDAGVSNGAAITEIDSIQVVEEQESASGSVAYVFLWDRQLSDAERALLDIDPYQFLRPAQNDPLFIGSVSGASAQTINADTIASASTVYQPSVTGGTASIAADFISSASAVYTASVTGAAGTIAADFISSASAVYNPSVTGGAATITADAIASASAVYDPSVTGGTATLSADFITSASAVYDATVSTGAAAQNLSADFISSASAVYNPTVSGGAGTVTADFISSTSVIFAPSVTGGSATISADTIASNSAIYEPALDTAATINVDFIASATAIYQPGVVGGAGTVNADFITSNTILFQPAVVTDQAISVDFISSAAAIYQPTVQDAAQLWTAVTQSSTTWSDVSDTTTNWTEI